MFCSVWYLATRKQQHCASDSTKSCLIWDEVGFHLLCWEIFLYSIVYYLYDFFWWSSKACTDKAVLLAWICSVFSEMGSRIASCIVSLVPATWGYGICTNSTKEIFNLEFSTECMVILVFSRSSTRLLAFKCCFW